jgi:mannose-6-phosphate isomerase-like protein (cupin superfamily)
MRAGSGVCVIDPINHRNWQAKVTSLMTTRLGSAPDAMAPDGSEVRLLSRTSRGSMAHFALAPHAVSKAVAHKTVEEIWYFVRGHGRMWRRLESAEEVTEVTAGFSVSIPLRAPKR